MPTLDANRPNYVFLKRTQCLDISQTAERRSERWFSRTPILFSSCTIYRGITTTPLGVNEIIDTL
jgi:hypothetical protein